MSGVAGHVGPTGDLPGVVDGVAGFVPPRVPRSAIDAAEPGVPV